MEVKNLQSKVLKHLEEKYCKVLVINLTTNEFQPFIVPKDEEDIIKKENFGIKEYWSWFAKSKYIQDTDRFKFKKFIENPEKGFIVYGRLCLDGTFHQVLMELSKFENTEDEEYLLCVRDIDGIYTCELEEVLEQIGTTDLTTGLLNRFAFDRDCKHYKNGNVGILFADLNGLKYTNDVLGHDKGDDLLKEFGKLLKDYFKGYKCYRIGGDEFVVISFNTNIGEFLRKSKSFYRFVQAMEVPMASIGYSVSTTLDGLIKEAESDMYIDKQLFYEKFPKMKRE